MVPLRRLLVAFAVVLLAVGGAFGQIVDDVFPMEPEDGATVGPRPVFRVGAEGRDLIKMKFRVVLSRDGFDTEDYVFDWMEDAAGWVHTALGGEFGALHRVQKPLADGEYEWRVDAWNGVDWVVGERTSRVIVDSIPPADVQGLEMQVEDGRTGIRLAWDPVTTDRDGAPEYVTKYHVYRYTRKTFFFVIRPFEIAVTEFPRYIDRDAVALDTELVFYKVTAEDAAGNEPDRRY